MSATSKQNDLRQELSEMTFEEIQCLQDKIGTKLCRKVLFSEKPEKTPKHFHRENKNRPREISSKKQVSRSRDTVPTKTQLKRDPRFDDLSGTYNDKLFKKSYSFIKSMKKNEKKQLESVLKDETEAERKQAIKIHLRKMESQDQSERQKAAKKAKKAEQRKERMNQLVEGKKPFYQSKSALHKEELVEKYKELVKGKKVDKYLIRKRKKLLQKERKQGIKKSR